jgi:hypothetical protein
MKMPKNFKNSKYTAIEIYLIDAKIIPWLIYVQVLGLEGGKNNKKCVLLKKKKKKPEKLLSLFQKAIPFQKALVVQNSK